MRTPEIRPPHCNNRVNDSIKDQSLKGLRSPHQSPGDQTPIEPDADAPDFFWLAGQGGYGIMMAPALGRAAAGLTVDGTLPDDLRASGLVEAEISPSRAALAK